MLNPARFCAGLVKFCRRHSHVCLLWVLDPHDDGTCVRQGKPYRRNQKWRVLSDNRVDEPTDNRREVNDLQLNRYLTPGLILVDSVRLDK